MERNRIRKLENIVRILMDRDCLSRRESEQAIKECCLRIISEAIAVVPNAAKLAAEILAEDLELQPDFLKDLVF